MSDVESLGLGRFGIYTFDFEGLRASRIRDHAQELEELGWPALWVPEGIGREAFTHAALLLSATRRIRIANGIAQVWGREARRTHGAALLLSDAHPDRHLLGLGYGGLARPGVKPLAVMAGYLDELDALDADPHNPAPAAPVRRVLAGYGPKMLELARDRSLGAHTYHVTTAHTAQAREILGPDALLAVEHAVLLEADPEIARTTAREHLAPYLASPYNAAKFRRLGYTDEDFADAGSDRLVDDLVYWGDLDTVAAKLHGQLAAGADHVAVQVIGTPPGGSALPHWRRLAEALV
ncbi:LLM class F420-dependent oxidoreductase [Kitasatospora xanthocidica]|uniref:TIGR03620 family F420-dependent LLM class oxidoreductase n=1 Tax=Kitasatospora xanthocidica TaxID=83382 RepID=UPI001991459F|nr:TIGR03620 family F420-dependent LLM class oxidoreductase [Kitasatospora xanthocidica]GHF30857.1 LLM class F420-dependent oxidoreductase [Kitasatospora xanthocidica]